MATTPRSRRARTPARAKPGGVVGALRWLWAAVLSLAFIAVAFVLAGGGVLTVWQLMPRAVLKLSGRKPPSLNGGSGGVFGSFAGGGSGGSGGCGGDGGSCGGSC